MSDLIFNSANVTTDTTPIQIVTKTKITIEQLEDGVQITGEDTSGTTTGTVYNGAFYATYGETTFNEIQENLLNGKIIAVNYQNIGLRLIGYFSGYFAPTAETFKYQFTANYLDNDNNYINVVITVDDSDNWTYQEVVAGSSKTL